MKKFAAQEIDGHNRIPPTLQTRRTGHRFTNDPLNRTNTPKLYRASSGSGSGSAYTTVSRDTARVSAT
jgi:hypothetical protein